MGAYSYYVDGSSQSSGTVTLTKGTYFCFVMSYVSNTVYGRTASIKNNTSGTTILSTAASVSGYATKSSTTITLTENASITCSAQGWTNVAGGIAVVIPIGDWY